MGFKLYATDPRSNTVDRELKPVEIVLSQEIEEPANLTFHLESNWNELNAEDDSSNAAQLNSTVRLMEDSICHFKGSVESRQLAEANGEKVIQIDALDKYHKIRNTAASINGEYIFSQTTPSKSLSNIVFKPITPSEYPFAPSSTRQATHWYPNYNYLEAWLPFLGFTINSLDQGLKQFVIVGDSTGEMYAGVIVEVIGSSGNNGYYTVVAAVYSSPNTTVTVAESIPDSGADGRMQSEFRTNHDYLVDPIIVLDDEIKLGTSYKAFLPTGLVRIDDQIFWYNGYIQKSDGHWYLINVYSGYYSAPYYYGLLGSVPDVHLNGVEVCQYIPYKIHPDISILYEGQHGASWDQIANNILFAQPEEGYFLSGVIYQTAADLYFADGTITDPVEYLRISYGVFDEMNANAVKLPEIVASVLEADILDGGPALTTSTYNIDIPNVRLTRVVNTDPSLTMDFIDNLLGTLGWQGTGELNVISRFHNSRDGKFNMVAISQRAGTATDPYDLVYPSASKIEREYALEDIYSAVLVKYKYEIPINLLTPFNYIQPNTGDLVGDNDASVLHCVGQTSQGQKWEDYVDDTDVRNMCATLARGIIDGKKQSGSGWRTADLDRPGPNVYAAICYFDDNRDGVCEDITLDRIRLILDLSRGSDTVDPLSFKVVGFTSFTPPVYNLDGTVNTPYSFTGEIDLATNLSATFPPALDTDDLKAYTVEATGISKTCQAVAIKFDGLPRTRDGSFTSHIMEFEVYGYETRALLIKLGDETSALDYTYLTASGSFSKLVDDEYGLYKLKIIDIGTATDAAAASLGRLALLESIALSQQRYYEIDQFTEIPILGQTCLFKDNFAGVVLGVGLHINEAGKTLTVRALNLNDVLI
jgi:hypothetical protein